MRKILYIELVLIIFNLLFINCVQAKYVIEENYEIINIKSADNEAPYINDRNYDVTDETFTEDVTVNYNDNLKIKSAKYWYNLSSNEFEGEGTDFDTGTVFSNDGWYKIEVSDMYDNITTYTFFIDQNFDSVEVICTEITDEGGILQINATDLASGVQKLELYIKDELYATFIYEEWYVTTQTAVVYADIDDLPFYEEAYVIATDFYGNSKTSESIIPNKNRIYDLDDLVKFQEVVNSAIDIFSDETIYLLNDIDLSTVCSSSIGSWSPISISSSKFQGIFEGNDHNILNLYINSTTENTGFFGVITNSTIQNLNVSGEIISNGIKTGGIVGYLSSGGNIINCTSNVTITASGSTECTAGIAGASKGTISYCINLGDISGNISVGGIVGYNINGYVEYCGNSGNITATGNYTGGIVGYTKNSSIQNEEIMYCYNTGNVTGIECVGGICGAAWDETNSMIISYVYNTGNVTITTSQSLNGGILGGTYYNCTGIQIDNVNVIKYGYNIGTISSSSSINQIVPSYANCTKMYYASGSSNASGYGTAKSLSLFKADLSNTSSVLYLLNSSTSGVWTIDSAYNSRLCNFSLAIKLKI